MTIPNSVTSIGGGAFSDCSSLASVTIGVGIRSIANAFNATDVKKAIWLSDTPPDSYYEFAEINYVCNDSYRFSNQVVCLLNSMKEINGVRYVPTGESEAAYDVIDYIGNETVITIEEDMNVINIEPYAFYDCRGLSSVSIPNSVTTIGDYAFSGCSSLTSVTIPEGVTSIGGSAFWNCSSLTSVNISDLSAWCMIDFEIDYYSNPLYYANNLYLNGSLLTDLYIPEDIEEIGDYAFCGYSGVSVTIPESVTSIGYSAFYDCSSLASVTIPEGVTSFGYDAFYGCSSLTSVNISDLSAWCRIDFGGYTSNPLYYGHNLYLNGALVTDLVIPKDISEIKSYAFSGGNCITSVTIPESVTTIGEQAFLDCSSLASVTIPEGVTSIESSTFRDCSSLASVTIPEGVTSIGGSAFSGCSSLASVTIPESVTSIESSTFYRCSRLESVTIPEGVTFIGGEAFYGCSSLASVTIPEGVTFIGYRAFYDCSRLAEITSLSAVPPVISVETFDSKNYLYSTLKVPVNSLVAYKTAEGWKNFWNIVSDADGGIDGVEDNAVNVTAKDGKILVEGIDDIVEVEVYNLSGQLVYGGTETTINVPAKDIYIVKVAGQTFKVAL